MRHPTTNRLLHLPVTSMLAVIAAALVAAGVAGCGGREIGSLDQIAIIKYRYSIDDAGDVVRIVGLARNTGELPTPEAEITATLYSRTGSFKGQNRVKLAALDAGAEEQFGIAVDSHGSVERVEIAVVEPGTVVDDGAEDAPANSGGDAPDDSSEEGDDDGS